MSLFNKKKQKKTGLPPGSLVHVGEKRVELSHITVIDFDRDNLQESTISNIEDAFPLKDMPTVTWINIDGLHDIDLIQKIGDFLGIHALVLEDILNTGQRPKLDDFDTYLSIVLKMLKYDPEEMVIDSEQISFILGDNVLISFQEKPGDVLDPVRERIRKAKGRIRAMGPDYLTYALMDAVLDNYFVLLETFGEQMEIIEDEIINTPSNEVMQRLHDMKREIISLRKQVWPLREVLSRLTKRDTPLFKDNVSVYISDLYDHTIHIIDTIESMRDFLAGLQDIYLSSLSIKMNEIMKVLTIMSTVFIPLSFIAGVYGMNFKYMPELEFKYGYLIFWIIIAALLCFMFIFFKKKKWL